MEEYEKSGYLDTEFKVFYLTDELPREFEYHYHDFDKIIIFLKGNVQYVIEGKYYRLEPQDIVLVNHNEMHKLKVEGNISYERIIIYAEPEFLESYRKKDCDLSLCLKKAGKEHSNVLRMLSAKNSKLFQIATNLKESLQCRGDSEEYARELYHRLLFLEFMIHLNRAVIGEKIEYINTDISNQKVVDIMTYIRINLTKDLNIDQLAQKFYISKYHMMRLFKCETGYSIGNYISNKRLLLAKDLIAKGMPITEACFECGFKEHSTFSRAYRNLFGETPRDTRKKSF